VAFLLGIAGQVENSLLKNSTPAAMLLRIIFSYLLICLIFVSVSAKDPNKEITAMRQGKLSGKTIKTDSVNQKTVGKPAAQGSDYSRYTELSTFAIFSSVPSIFAYISKIFDPNVE
jgi:hypothetical protein